MEFKFSYNDDDDDEGNNNNNTLIRIKKTNCHWIEMCFYG